MPYTYSKKTVVGNWFEDRLAPLQPERDFPDRKTVRPVETELANLEKSFSVLSRLARNPYHISEGLPDDGFRELVSSNKEDFMHPKNRKAWTTRTCVPSFITTTTVPEVVHDERRPVKGQRSGYGAPLQRHDLRHGERFFNTAYRDSHGYPKPAATVDRSQKIAAGLGVLRAADAPEGLRTGQLAGEMYKPTADPSEATEVQRAWTYQLEPCLANIQYGGKDNKPELSLTDNELSLPIGEGGHRELDRTLKERGKLFRMHTNITTGKEAKYGLSIFRDD